MPEKQIRPNEKTSIAYLADLGTRMYHSGYYGEYDRRLRPLQTEAQHKLGQLSVTKEFVLRNNVEDGWELRVTALVV